MGTKATYTNDNHLGISMALWLARDTYDHDPAEAAGITSYIISATTLLKPTKAIVLETRLPLVERVVDIADLSASRIGQSIHQSIEDSYLDESMKSRLSELGFSKKVIDNVIVNPDKSTLASLPDALPIYIEKRAFREVKLPDGNKVTISGKFDQIVNGTVEDNKSTGVYKYMNMDQSDKSDYSLQLSIYKWLNPDLITSDTGQINFIFTDWKRNEASRNPKYPARQVMEVPFQLMSEFDTNNFIVNKLMEIQNNSKLQHDTDMIECNDEELWRSPEKHKYYAKKETADKGGRSTRNFDTLLEAMNFRASKGTGTVITVGGDVKRCNYCNAAPLCQQRLRYI